MNRTGWATARLVGVGATFAVLLWRVGSGPFVDGIHAVDGTALAAAVGIGVLTTVCCAWRWKVVARGLGVDLPLPVAVAAYYRSMFLNVTLPGGVVGDVHRGVSHGREVSDVGRGLRAVAWERTAGQIVQAVLTVIVLLVLPSPVWAAMPLVALGLAVTLVVLALVARARPGHGRSRRARLHRAVAGDIRDGLVARQAWVGIAIASALAVAGFAATFVIAARTAGTDASVATLLPLALLVLMAMVLPNIAGWGPREGITAWAFSAAGLGAAQGVATAVVFGVMVFVSSLPGAVVLVLAWLHRSPLPGRPEPLPAPRRADAARAEGVAHV